MSNRNKSKHRGNRRQQEQNMRAAPRLAFIVHGAKMRRFSWNCANKCVAQAAALAIAKL
jgi:hypothetical protein